MSPEGTARDSARKMLRTQEVTSENIAAVIRNAVVLVVICGALLIPAAAQTTAIRAGKLIDPDSGKVLTGQTILIRDNKVEAVGSNVAIPSNAKIIDFTKMTVLPGLIDCHTHLADGADGDEWFKETSAQIALESVPNAASPSNPVSPQCAMSDHTVPWS